MKQEDVAAIANAVLYEGYLLYPYRRSAVKNQQRWTFGVVYPRAYSEARGGTEPWTMRTECLLEAEEGAAVDVSLRFLHLLDCRRAMPEDEPPDGRRAGPERWEEGFEREVSVPGLAIAELAAEPQRVAFAFPGGRLADEGTEARDVAREHRPLAGAVTIAASRVGDGVYRLAVGIENTTDWPDTGTERRDAVLLRSLVSTHTILRVRHGAFVSLMDPPAALREVAQGCRNERTWPVLIGDDGERDAMLSSPIILYDYPRIAPESVGPLFDGTEIDEILTLRIMTLTDEEKEEMRQGDERAREVLERTEALAPEQLLKLHGAIRGLRPVGEGEHEEGTRA